MNRAIIYIGILLTFLITGCGASKEQKQNRELEKLALEVMNIHDRSMPDHGKLFKLKKSLLAIYESVSDTLVKKEISSTIEDIDHADRGMMDWMHHYTAPADYLPFEEKKAYYLEQKKIIEDVEKLTTQTIEKAKQIIDAYPSVE